MVVAMKNPILIVITAGGLGLSLGWGLAAQEPKKEWKGQEEYNLFQAYQKADPKGRIDALDKWKAAFPASDFAEEREEQYLFVYQQLNMNRQAFDKAVEILKTRPNHFYSLSAIERLVYTLPPPQTSADLDTAGARLAQQVTRLRGGRTPVRSTPAAGPAEPHLSALHERAHALAGRALLVAASRADTAAAILAAQRMDAHAAALVETKELSTAG